MNIFSRLFSWIAGVFRSDRAKWIKRILPHAIVIARRIHARDWDQDGTVESARDEFVGILTGLPRDVIVRVFNEYVPGTTVIDNLPVRLLKKVLAIALLCERLVVRDEPVPSYGILDSAAQLAYEQAEKDQPSS